MNNKNQFVVAGFMAGFVIFASTVSYAAQACQEMPGELHLISVEGSKRGEFMEREIEVENRIRLNEKALEICSGGEVCIEDASVKTTYFFHPWLRKTYGTMTAVVNCLK